MRVVLASDHEVLVEGLCAVLSPFRHRVAVVRTPAPCSTAEAISSVVEQTAADVVVLEVSPVRVHLVGELLAQRPSLRILAIGHDGDQSFLEALGAGAKGYVFTSLSGAKLTEAIESVAAGEAVLDPRLTAPVIDFAVNGNGRASATWPGAELGLGRRESQVLALLCEGLRNREIAQRLGVGEETVKTHTAGIYRKLGATDRAHAVAKALREGIIR